MQRTRQIVVVFTPTMRPLAMRRLDQTPSARSPEAAARIGESGSGRSGDARSALGLVATITFGLIQAVRPHITSSYELVESEPAGTDSLRVWRKRRDTDEDWYYVETEQGVCRVGSTQLRAAESRWKAKDRWE
jgi:hypothetical protein